MLVDTYSQKGEKIGQTRLPKEIFEIPINSDLVHQVVISQMARRRKIIAHTKTRAKVRGGGKKPWRQKGTGRARAGSVRSPIWRGGGVTFGPTKARVFKKKIPKKMRRKALFMILSVKAKNNFLIVLDSNSPTTCPKTKELLDFLKKLPCKGRNSLIALPEMDKNTILASRNIPNVKTCQAKDLNCLDLLSFKYLIIPKETIKVIKEIFV